MKTYKLLITGKVQGVWYRASAKDKALSLNIKGKIWNTPAGAVEAFAQGEESDILDFIEWCKKGPPLARVENVVVENIEGFNEEFQGFDITRNQ